VIIALILAALTAIEVSTYYIDFGPLFMPTLFVLMIVKFVIVVSYFMHLKFDNKLFSYLFYSGLILAILVYAGALATFKFFLQKG
jgi:cytochrome c oxidase subunit 4